MEPFQILPRLTQIAIAIRPGQFINREVLPPIAVSSETFSYTEYDIDEQFRIVDDLIGRTGPANEIELGGKERTAKTQPRGLTSPVPVRDLRKAETGNTNYDPMANATTTVANLIELGREKRVSDLVFNTASYLADNQQTLAGSSQWSHADSTPLADISEALDTPLVRPNTIVLGQKVWTKLRSNSEIVESVTMSGAGDKAKGRASRDAVADLFEVDRVLVGRARHNAAKKGQADSYTRLWGEHCSLLYIDPDFADPMGGVPTFGFMAEWEGREAGTFHNPNIGKSGAEVVKVTEDVLEMIVSKQCGYFFQNAVAG